MKSLLRSARRIVRACAHSVMLSGFLTAAIVLRLPAQAPPPHSTTSGAHIPLTLTGLLDSVRARHPMIAAAQARVRAAEGGRVTAGRFGNPVVSYQAENVTFPRAASVAGIDRESMAMVMLPLEPLYQRGARVTQATAMVRAATADAERESQRTALDAAHAFYRAALAEFDANTGRDLVAWLDSVVTYNSARVKEGIAAEADLLRSTLERDRAAAELAISEAELAQARSQLALFLGMPPSGVTAVAANALLAAPPQSLVTPRAELRAARERATAATAGIASERRMLVRDIGLTLGSKRMMGTTSMIAGLSLPIPLFDRNSGEIARASAERDAAMFEVAHQEHTATADLIAAEESARILSERATQLSSGGTESLLARADESRRIALAAYREGAIPLLNVLDAARMWGEVRMTYYRVLYAQHESVLALVVARGGDLFSTTPAPASAPNR